MPNSYIDRKTESKKAIQESQYNYPYHYIPRLSHDGFTQTQNVNWGFEYLSSLNFILDMISEHDFESLLDVGCGDGRLLHELKTRYPEKKLSGIDTSGHAINLAKVMSPGIDFIHGDITKNRKSDAKYDLITSIEVLEHIPTKQLQKFVEATHCKLKKDGLLILTVPTTNIPLQSKHYRHFTLTELDKEIGKFFTIRKHFFLNRNNRRARLIRKLLTNRFFILNAPKLKIGIYNWYRRSLFQASEKDGSRLVAVCTPK